MRHFLSSLALAAALMAPAPILAQNLFEPVVYINNAAITRYEVEQRQRFMQILGNPGTTAEEAQQALIDDRLRLRARPNLRFAGQVTGVEGYVESAAIGLIAGRFAAAEILGQELAPPPADTALGALLDRLAVPQGARRRLVR